MFLFSMRESLLILFFLQLVLAFKWSSRSPINFNAFKSKGETKKTLAEGHSSLSPAQATPAISFRKLEMDCIKKHREKLYLEYLVDLDDTKCIGLESKKLVNLLSKIKDELKALQEGTNGFKTRFSKFSKGWKSKNFVELFEKNDMDYFHSFFKKESNCHKFWKVHGPSINAFLASKSISNNLSPTLIKIILGKFEKKPQITLYDKYLGFSYFNLGRKFEFRTLDLFCKMEDVKSNLLPLFSSNSQHITNIMVALEKLLQVKLQVQLASFVKKISISYSLSATLPKNLRSNPILKDNGEVHANPNKMTVSPSLKGNRDPLIGANLRLGVGDSSLFNLF